MEVSDLKKRKKDLHLTTAKLAYLAELPVGTVSKIMTGETKNPSYVTIEKIDAALLKEEMILRLENYRKELFAYIAEHSDETVDQKDFEKMYREKHHLTDEPLPYAVMNENNTTKGNLALYREYYVSLNDIKNIEENRLVELLKGQIIFNEAPSFFHQQIVQNLGRCIESFIKQNHGKCRMFNVGVNVRLCEDDYTMLIPDVVVNCDDSRLTETGIDGAPDWIIEVVSKGSRYRDYNSKMHAYMEYGVREYWIVDPEKERVTTYIEGEPMMAYVYSFDDVVPVYIYEGKLSICLKDILAEK